MMLSEVLNDRQKVLTVIFEVGPQAAMVKISNCERVRGSASARNNVICVSP